MMQYQDLLHEFTTMTKNVMEEKLTGIYLHGSLAMGCFHPEKSDIDLIIVIEDAISDAQKRKFMEGVVRLNGKAPAKGLELSVVKREYCKPFVYPTPFELHFSPVHLQWFHDNPQEYVEKMKGTDKDLAAHFTILYHRGITLWGKEIQEVFSEVSPAEYFDSIWCDIENAGEEITGNAVYVILNLCRVLAYRRDKLILSKQEGGEWGLVKVPAKYAGLILGALKAYQAGVDTDCEEGLAEEYAEYMLAQIKGEALVSSPQLPESHRAGGCNI